MYGSKSGFLTIFSVKKKKKRKKKRILHLFESQIFYN